MTPQRALLLAELLDELAQDPNGWIPEEAYGSVQNAFAQPYLELCFVRQQSNALQILLAYRKDAQWNGWHIPGGMWRTRHTLEKSICSLTESELGPGVGASFLAKGPWDKWDDHPIGPMISHVVILRGDNIVESETLGWFAELPQNMISWRYATYFEAIKKKVFEENLL